MAYGETPLEKGSIFRLNSQKAVVDEFVFQFNPETYQMNVGNTWRMSQAPGQYIPAASFQRFNNTTFNFELFIYGRARGDVASVGDVNVDQEMARLELFSAPGGNFTLETPQFVSPGKAILVLGRRIVRCTVDNIRFNVKLMDRAYNPILLTAAMQFTVASDGLESDLSYLANIRTRAGLAE